MLWHFSWKVLSLLQQHKQCLSSKKECKMTKTEAQQVAIDHNVSLHIQLISRRFSIRWPQQNPLSQHNGSIFMVTNIGNTCINMQSCQHNVHLCEMEWLDRKPSTCQHYRGEAAIFILQLLTIVTRGIKQCVIIKMLDVLIPLQGIKASSPTCGIFNVSVSSLLFNSNRSICSWSKPFCCGLGCMFSVIVVLWGVFFQSWPLFRSIHVHISSVKLATSFWLQIFLDKKNQEYF